MQPNQILEQLGYVQSPHWITQNKADVFTLPVWRILENESLIEVCGTYVFRSSPPTSGHSHTQQADAFLPPRPAVYVIKAETEEAARSAHQKIWNLGITPFLIVILPHTVKVYSGFDFQAQARQTKPIAEAPLSISAISEVLESFRAYEIDTGRIWTTQSKHLNLNQKVDQRLLKSLSELGKALKSKGVERSLAHRLIGKYIYIYYLYQRQILTPVWFAKHHIDFAQIIGKEANAQTLQILIDCLDQTFNGQIFPLSVQELGEKADEIIQFVADIFRGDHVSGQRALPDFEIYDFSCIPIEMLSAVYEQFLRDEEKHKSIGAVYTSEALADYLLSELHSVKPLKKGLKILDPACGSGIFLVLAYRRLIEQSIQDNQGQKLSLQALSTLLTTSIFGVERVKEACYVAEFSLLLTLLSYADPQELQNASTWRLPNLHQQNIFESDFFDAQCPVWSQELKFDWIVGNPPWDKITPTNSEQQIMSAWIKENHALYPVGDQSPSEAFSWRVTQALSQDGYVGLLVKATSLFNAKSQKYRQAFFTRHQVRRITNFSNLVYLLFERRAKARAATVIYTKATQTDRNILHYGPFVANQKLYSHAHQKRIWSLTLYENEIKVIAPQEAQTGAAQTWKLALWGNNWDQQVLKRLKRIFPLQLGELITQRHWKLHQGCSIETNQSTSNKLIEKMPCYYRLNANAMAGQHYLTVPTNAIDALDADAQYFYQPRIGKIGLEVASAPHLYLTPTCAAYSDQDFLLPKTKPGLSAPSKDTAYLMALSVYLNSSIGKYLLFFESTEWGVGRNAFTPQDIKRVAVPKFTPEQIEALAKVHQRLSHAFSDPLFAAGANQNELIEQLDQALGQILEIPEYLRIVAQEFFSIRYQQHEGKTQIQALQSPSEKNFMDYALYLRDQLYHFSYQHHLITLTQYPEWVACRIEITSEQKAFTPLIQTQAHLSREDQQLWQSLKQEFSQWIYVQQSLRLLEGKNYHIWKAPRLIDWTRTQAMIDADEIIAEVLSYEGAFA